MVEKNFRLVRISKKYVFWDTLMVAAIQEEFELNFDNLSQELLDKLEDMYNKMDQDQNGEISPKGNCSLFSRIDDELKILFIKNCRM